MANQSLDFPNRVRVISVYLEKIEVQSIVITVNSIKKNNHRWVIWVIETAFTSKQNIEL